MHFFTILETLAKSQDRYIKGASTQLLNKREDLEKILARADAIRENNTK